MAKTAAQLQREIDDFVREGRNGRSTHSARLVILDDDGQAIASPSQQDLLEYGNRGTVRGRKDYEIGVAFTDHNDNDLAISVSRSEVKRFYL